MSAVFCLELDISLELSGKNMEGHPHFHSWLVPRGKDVNERGLEFLARDDSCSDEEASALADKLREEMR